MTDLQIQRIIEDIERTLKCGESALEDKEKGEHYSNVLKTISFMLSQELK